MMRGLSERTLVQHVSSVTKHVFPTLYPRMVDTSAGGMGRDSYRAFGNDLLKAVRNLFSEAGQEGLGLDVQHRLLAAEAQAATARAAASHASIGRALVEGLFNGAPSTGGVSRAAAAEALEAGRAAAEGRRAQTAHTQTCAHAMPRDLELMADVQVSEPFARNRAMVADAYMVSAVCSGLRPTSAGVWIRFRLWLWVWAGAGAGPGAGVRPEGWVGGPGRAVSGSGAAASREAWRGRRWSESPGERWPLGVAPPVRRL